MIYKGYYTSMNTGSEEMALQSHDKELVENWLTMMKANDQAIETRIEEVNE